MPDLKDDLVFDLMTTKADNTRVDLFANESKGYDKKDLHKALMVAGFTPGLGNIADAVDALLYALEGEFGEAAISSTAMIPFLGQMVSARKVAKAGEEMVTVYRGVDKWFPGQMVKEGNFVGGSKYRRTSPSPLYTDPKRPGAYSSVQIKEGALYTTPNTDYAKKFQQPMTVGDGNALSIPWTGKKTNQAVLLEFEVPKKYIEKNAEWRTEGWDRVLQKALDEGAEPVVNDALEIIFQEGLPKEFLKKVHKGK